MYDVAIIGCGVVGAACAFELSKYSLKVVVLEKENDVACGTTKANSAIVHAGYDPHPGTLMAKLNVEGSKMMEALCRDLDVPYRRCGSHVLAFSDSDRRLLQELLERGNKNGVEGLRIIEKEELRRMEPQVSELAVASLWAPSAAIISPWELALALIETAVKNGVRLELKAGVNGIEKTEQGFKLDTAGGIFEAKLVINAAGLSAGEVQSMAGADVCSIQPNRGEYFLLDKAEGCRVNSVIFRCPDEKGKGVLVSPTVHGNLIVGPNAVNIDDPADTSNSSDGMDFVKSSALGMVPGINFRENIRNFAGVRANHAKDDFLIGENPSAAGLYDLAGIKSPGLTASPAIGRMACSWVREKLDPKEDPDFIGKRRVVRLAGLSEEEKDRIISADPLYGRVICRCENVSEGEIVAALHSPVHAVSINGIKRRTGSGMGRCQGGFCGPRIAEIIARELDMPITQVLQEGEGSYLFTGFVRENEE